MGYAGVHEFISLISMNLRCNHCGAVFSYAIGGAFSLQGKFRKTHDCKTKIWQSPMLAHLPYMVSKTTMSIQKE